MDGPYHLYAEQNIFCWTYAAVLTAYDHKYFCNFDSVNNALSYKVFHDISVVPYWCGEYV